MPIIVLGDVFRSIKCNLSSFPRASLMPQWTLRRGKIQINLFSSEMSSSLTFKNKHKPTFYSFNRHYVLFKCKYQGRRSVLHCLLFGVGADWLSLSGKITLLVGRLPLVSVTKCACLDLHCHKASQPLYCRCQHWLLREVSYLDYLGVYSDTIRNNLISIFLLFHR